MGFWSWFEDTFINDVSQGGIYLVHTCSKCGHQAPHIGEFDGPCPNCGQYGGTTTFPDS